ncbi:hypothetical protein ACOACO_03360 [Nocardioides sp. CPCC 205120]|uniref:hypothetical protein n=1 Tax=Nocardioides sp. CPCC 205120 TaxID=3406462 RepID=UPI003B503D8A
MIPDLGGLTPEVLVDLTNVGTVRRATREVESGSVALTFTETDHGLEVAGDDGTRCLVGTGPFATWTCDCLAGSACRHLVRAVLAWRARAEAERGETEPAPAASQAAGQAASQAAGPAVAPAAAPVAAPVGVVEVVEPRVRRAAERLRAERGLVATLTRGTRVGVVLHVPVELTVRFGADADPRFALCECGRTGCAHVDHALAVLAASPDSDGLVVLEPTVGAPGDGGPGVEGRAGVVPDRLRADADAWWALLVELGLGAAAELTGSAVRLAGDLEAAGLPHPAAVARDLADQLTHQTARDAQVAPERLVLLVGELEARLRRLERGPAPGGVPTALVAGQPPVEETTQQRRLVGLGAEHAHVGGWSTLRVLVADVRTGSVHTLTAEAADREQAPVTPQQLGRASRGGARLVDWARGAVVLPPSRRRGHELVVPRGRVAVRATTTLEVPDGSPVLAARFADLAPVADLPAVLGPRAPVAGVAAARVVAVEDVDLDPVRRRVRAQLRDADGATVLADLGWAPRAAGAAGAIGAALLSGEVDVVAGRWVRRADGLVVHLTAVWGAGGALVGPLAEPAGPGAEPTPTSPRSSGTADPWDALRAAVVEALGRLLVLGVRRGGPAATRDLLEASREAEGLGLLRVADLLRTAAAALGVPGERERALADVAVLLAFAE